ncbi:hypothetical protein [Aquiflexum lacus]|uniref:hypothetical protein n=1 Tax=Aquiflexum lacus TaxID=2483805 RepID=UPI001893A460|nr:hypothetical protein [Aquiflexum lacus]
MKQYKIFVFSILFLISGFSSAQTEDVLKINVLNPAISYEKATGSKTTLDASLGFGYNYSYPNLTLAADDGFQYLFAMFVDVQARYFYNFEKRLAKNKAVRQNSGNFLALRLLYTGPGPEEASSFNRTSNHFFAVGPTWGLQRDYGKINLLFSLGPILYFDPNGNRGFFPLNPEINIGFNLN